MTPEQRASKVLFDNPKFVPHTNGPFVMPDDEKITYSGLVARYRAEDEGKATPRCANCDALATQVLILTAERDEARALGRCA